MSSALQDPPIPKPGEIVRIRARHYLVEGVEVFRRLYTAVGFGPVVALTRLPGVRQLLDLAYHAFAKHRLRLTGHSRRSD